MAQACSQYQNNCIWLAQLAAMEFRWVEGICCVQGFIHTSTQAPTLGLQGFLIGELCAPSNVKPLPK